MKARNILEEASVNTGSSWAQSMTSTEELLGLPIDELFARLNTLQTGLRSQEADSRLEIYGHNEFAKRRKRTTAVEFLSHFRSPLIIILLLAGLVSGFFWRDDKRCHHTLDSVCERSS